MPSERLSSCPWCTQEEKQAIHLISSPFSWSTAILYLRTERERWSSLLSVSLGSALPWKNPGLSSRASLIEVNQRHCFRVSQPLPAWIGLCSPETPLRFLINHPDTLTWDLSSRAVLTVNYSRKEGSVLHWPDHTPPGEWKYCSKEGFCSCPIWWTSVKSYQRNMRIWIWHPAARLTFGTFSDSPTRLDPVTAWWWQKKSRFFWSVMRSRLTLETSCIIN